MKILVDENIPSITVNELRTLGHDVLDVRGTPQQGMEDDELWRLAQADQRLSLPTKASRSIETRPTTAFSSFACGSPTSNAFTPEPWQDFASSKRATGVVSWWWFETLCRA